MISQDQIKRLSIRYQTNDIVIAREYLQHYFLLELYKQKGSDKLLFKGGTCLRLVFNSPRFSEDLDFTASQSISYFEIEEILTEVYFNLSNWGFEIDVEEAKKTTGGYLTNAICSFEGYKINLKIEISFRVSHKKINKVISQPESELIAPYDIVHLTLEEIVSGKLAALMARSKPRDWYDLYFLLKKNYLNVKQKELLPCILKQFKNYKGDTKKEIKEFLPKNHQLILRDFKRYLIGEINKNI
ncbi:MAG: nucleotidyl transferase AbiEii/AbiGii toxin family protein [Patescibacteria group bacterium]